LLFELHSVAQVVFSISTRKNDAFYRSLNEKSLRTTPFDHNPQNVVMNNFSQLYFILFRFYFKNQTLFLKRCIAQQFGKIRQNWTWPREAQVTGHSVVSPEVAGW
jgi:hypothetical protein